VGAARDWTGVVQGDLTVLKRSGKDRWGSYLWRCKCKCGVVAVKSSGALHNGTKSCSVGCGVSKSNQRRTAHGGWTTPLYKLWTSIKQRCTNPKAVAYHRYGGRGINMHPTWAADFARFRTDVGEAPTKGMTLDRIDNDRGYVPGNVRWATRKQQSNNRSNNVRVRIAGVYYTLAEAADVWGVPYSRVFDRYKAGLRGVALVAPKKHNGGK